ncbi:hypothetical protein COCMIDRAFT_22538 [Bipolaris oryzae ATCC 44560]|uniref:Uncharacterized protein n=1 Tax=Bipolaris oryzae ATCC 44560 TaxID=930090 RepID=W7A1S2_COCMI|nr:uncharacterized protein COCMIDRAFT_22538 [Bipolaris oryzae ATCC 44560]EUC49986.1 hypothetical protein COCMIDRAFT_22538 [Bipolaris oryzae ATCC 44560]
MHSATTLVYFFTYAHISPNQMAPYNSSSPLTTQCRWCLCTVNNSGVASVLTAYYHIDFCPTFEHCLMRPLLDLGASSSGTIALAVIHSNYCEMVVDIGTHHLGNLTWTIWAVRISKKQQTTKARLEIRCLCLHLQQSRRDIVVTAKMMVSEKDDVTECFVHDDAAARARAPRWTLAIFLHTFAPLIEESCCASLHI